MCPPHQISVVMGFISKPLHTRGSRDAVKFMSTQAKTVVYLCQFSMKLCLISEMLQNVMGTCYCAGLPVSYENVSLEKCVCFLGT